MGECVSVLVRKKGICILGSGGIEDNSSQDEGLTSRGCCCCAGRVRTAKLGLEQGWGCSGLCCLHFDSHLAKISWLGCACQPGAEQLEFPKC